MKSKIYIGALTSLALVFAVFNQAFAQVQPKTIQEIQLLLQEKTSRTPAQQKISSQLLQAVRESRGQQMTPGVRLQPANVNADSKGSLLADISANVSDALILRIEALGGKIIYPSWEYKTIRAQINLSMVETIAGYPEVLFIQPAVRSITVGSGNPNRDISILPPGASGPVVLRTATGMPGTVLIRRPFKERAEKVRNQLLRYLQNRGLVKPLPLTGSVVSEGDRTHRADDTRSTYGYSGQGIRIGVLSDSYNSLGGEAADISSGNLPGPGNPLGNNTPVTVLADITGGSDEGRAMLQIVHDLAPAAQLFFASANIGEASFASNILSLRNAPNNCDIIIDDVFYFDEPVFQDGIIAQAVNTVTAGGALYFSSAGNEGSVAKGTSGIWEGDFNDAGSPVFIFPGGAKAGTIHNFGTLATPVNGDIITTAGFVYNMNWSDPFGASGNDYDLFLVSSAGTVKGSSTNIQNGTQNPYEQITPPTLVAGDRLLVFKTGTALARAFSINTLRGRLTKTTTGQTHGHSSALNAFSVAATPAVGPYPAAFSTSSLVETFSSDGPRKIFYNADGSAVTPGNVLFGTNGGLVRNKPDITAADGVSTTLSPSSGLNPFYGTSAAAPHAGAIAALLKSANQALTATQIRTILTTTTLDVESAGYDNISGFGIVQALQAMQAVSPTPISSINLGTKTVTEGTISNNNGAIDPGESGSLVVQLTDPSSVAATSVNTVLTTSTAGVTITQGIASYGTIAAGGNASNTATPFTFTTSSSITCGSSINFILTVTYGGGGTSPLQLSFPVIFGSQPANISSTLGSAPPTGAGFISATGTQTGRLNRNAPVSVCGSQKTTPILAAITGARVFDSYNFTNTSPSSQCITATLNAANGVNLYFVAYNNNGYVPATPNINFLADMGSSGASQSFSFTIPGNQSFTLVVSEVTAGLGVGSAYNISATLTNCSTVYYFTGNGNWDNPANWSNNTVPPSNLPGGAEIIINPAPADECILNVPQTISTGAKITVQPGKKFRVLNNLVIQ